MSRACYVCGGYLYRGARHVTCEPLYRRARFNACSVCGGLARGLRHKRCAILPGDYSPCEYCGAATRGRYHKRCTPLGDEMFAMFPDMPEVVQRRCATCREWFPFAAVDGAVAETATAWSAHGLTASSRRPVFVARCRACMAQSRRDARVTAQLAADEAKAEPTAA
jgi:hypothetical protein